MGTVRTVLVLVALAAVAVIVYRVVHLGTRLHDIAKRPAQHRAEVAHPTTKIIAVTADQLYADYSSDDVRADQLYKDKLIEVTGPILAIKSDLTGEPYVLLGVDHHYDVRANCQDGFAKSSLTVGQPGTLRCLGGGKVGGSPLLRYCLVP